MIRVVGENSMLKKLVIVPGIKRTIAGILDAVALPLSAIPGGEALVLPINSVSAAFGGTGLIQATKQKTVQKFGLSSIASVFSVLTLIAHAVPSFQIYLPLLQKLAAISGAAAVGSLKTNVTAEALPVSKSKKVVPISEKAKLKKGLGKKS